MVLGSDGEVVIFVFVRRAIVRFICVRELRDCSFEGIGGWILVSSGDWFVVVVVVVGGGWMVDTGAVGVFD